MEILPLYYEKKSIKNRRKAIQRTNRVKVTGVSADAVTLKFGEIETAIAGAFESFASEKIFEDQTKALLA